MDFARPDVVIRVMLTYDRASDLYLGDLARRGYSERTLTTYARTHFEFNEFLPRNLDVSKITADDYRRYLLTKRHLAPGTVAGIEAHLAGLSRFLLLDGKIARDPFALLPRTKRTRPEDLDVVTVGGDEVRLLLGAGQTWTERLAPAMPAYLGPRRRAIASARLADYDRGHREGPRMRFREKGDKIIWKPVAPELARLISTAEADGAYDRYDYIVPPEGHLQRTGPGAVRDDRVIWRVIRRLADRVGIVCHVHALRAAFAVFYDETFPGDIIALRDLMGHRSVKTTELYLRRRDKQAGMQRVRQLSWGVAGLGDAAHHLPADSGGFTLESSPAMGAGGFEPPSQDSQAEHRRSSQHQAIEAAERRLGALRARSSERAER